MARATFNPDHVLMTDYMEGDIPEQAGLPVIDEFMQNSVVMQLAQYEEMDGLEKEFDIFLGGVGAYWVGEGQVIKTSKPTWAKAKMRAHKLGVILPASREFLTYSMTDFFEVMRPQIARAFQLKFDSATLLNVENPYTQSIVQSAQNAENYIEGDLNVANYDQLVDGLYDNGFEPSTAVSKVANTSVLRQFARDINGVNTLMYDHTARTLDGVGIVNAGRDLVDFPKGGLILGDFDYVRYGIPYNMSYEISTQATLSSIVGEDGEPINLFERELVALRATMDIGFMVVSDSAFGAVMPTIVDGGEGG